MFFIFDYSGDDEDNSGVSALYTETFFGVKGNNFSDYALASYRMMFQRVNNTELEEDAFDISDAYLNDFSEKLEKKGIDKNFILKCLLSQHSNFNNKLRIFEYEEHFYKLTSSLTEPLN